MKPFGRALLAITTVIATIAAMAVELTGTAQAARPRHDGNTYSYTLSVSPQSKSNHYTAKQKKRSTKKSANARPAATPKVCAPPIASNDRTFSCLAYGVELTTDHYVDGDIVGSEVFDYIVELQLTLSARSTTLHLLATIIADGEAGDDPKAPASITISSICAGGCVDASPQLLAIGSPEGGTGNTVTNRASVASNQVDWPQITLTDFADVGGTESNELTWTLPLIRCDHYYPRVWKPGCVFPLFNPTIDMSGLPHIDRGIRKVQGRGEHYGKPGGKNPLTRATSAEQTRNNRRQVCPKSLKRPKGYSCDEYPFASTEQGGTTLPAVDRIFQMVPAGENHKQGVILAQGYYANRILPGDPFYVYAG